MTKSAPSQPSRRRGYRQVPNSRAWHSSGVERCRPQRHLLDEDRRTHDLALGRLIGEDVWEYSESFRQIIPLDPHESSRAGGKVGTLVHARQITEADCGHPPTPPFVRANGKSVGLVNALSRGNGVVRCKSVPQRRPRTRGLGIPLSGGRPAGSDGRRSVAAAGFKLRQGRPREVGPCRQNHVA